MHRLFVALRPPAPVRERLMALMEAVPGARWQDDAQLHLTLAFLGELPSDVAEDVALALSRIQTAAVDLTLTGVGTFGPGGSATTLWVGVAPSAPLGQLYAKVVRALQTAGLPPPPRAFHPHITVARLARSDGRHPAVAAWQQRHAGFAGGSFRCDRLTLCESELARGGATYTTVARWPLVSR